MILIAILWIQFLMYNMVSDKYQLLAGFCSFNYVIMMLYASVNLMYIYLHNILLLSIFSVYIVS